MINLMLKEECLLASGIREIYGVVVKAYKAS
jgi:hypothetical protein